MSTPKYTVANLSGTYTYQLTRPGLVKEGTVTFDGAGNLTSTDLDVPGETRPSAANGSDYVVNPDGSGSMRILFHMQQGGVFGPWFKFEEAHGFQKLIVESEDSSITGTLEAQ